MINGLYVEEGSLRTSNRLFFLEDQRRGRWGTGHPYTYLGLKWTSDLKGRLPSVIRLPLALDLTGGEGKTMRN
jgi:hypothetical protein